MIKEETATGPPVFLTVNAILSTPAWLVRAAPAVSPKPGKTLITPGGKPASSESAARWSAVSGVCSAGLQCESKLLQWLLVSADMYRIT